MRAFKWALLGLLCLVGAPLAAMAQTPDKPALTASPAGAKTYFIDLKDGATIAPTTTVHFGLTGMGVAPAGVAKANSGHFHLLIDTELPPLDQPIPNDENHLHYGAGQTEASITLPKGKHTLQLLLGDANHIPHDPPVYSQPIVVYVGMTPPKPPPPKYVPHHWRRHYYY
jgi:hypothetical protein